MNIQTKIEEIRSQPEHIRMRYVLVSVGVSMLFISVLWIFSITTSFQSQKDSTTPSLTEYDNQTNQGIPDTRAAQLGATPSLNEWIKK